MTVPQRGVRTEIPGPRSRELMARGAFDMQAFYRAMVFDDAASQGTSLVDVDGNVFLDLFSSFALGALGYNHPRVLAAARSDEMARALANPSSTPFLTAESWIRFTETVERRYAPKGMAKMFCVDGGGEGVEAALKAAFVVFGEKRRAASNRPKNPLELAPDALARVMDNAGTDAVVVSFAGAFHGRGLGPLSATHSKPIHKADLPAFPWPQVPFPASRWPLDRYADENARAEAGSLRELERVLEAYAGRVAAVLVEPVQSEGGDRHASPAFFQAVQRLAKQAGAAFVLDEVQTGVAISGTWWCHEQLALPTPPDLVTFGKKMQLGGFFASPEYAISQFGRMYQTRNGDRARGLLALAIFEAIEAEDLLRNVRETGAYFLSRLQELSEAHPALITDARGKGFLLAFDLPTPALRDEFLKRCQQRAVFATYTGTRSVRLRPHLVTTRAEVDEAMGVFRAVASELG
jgi:4-aminobutyrate aminotransferase/(S)-3-amino-2-methylpropionate transaminase